jgi:glycosyltransferase involved in cell wall biosynthesis
MLSSYKNWILEATIRESSSSVNVRVNLVFIPTRKRDLLDIKDLVYYLFNIRTKKQSLFVNQASFFQAILQRKIYFNLSLSEVFYTHYSDIQINRDIQAKYLAQCNKIYVYNSSDKQKLVSDGVPESKIHVVYGAIDRKIYYPKPPVNDLMLDKDFPYVLIIGDCKPRKNPELTIATINRMTSINFVIHGRFWHEYFIANSIPIPFNLDIREFNLKKNPELVRNASTYLSLSKLEGGPYTTLEALASGTPVVVTSTGWNPEIVKINSGILLPLDPPLDIVTCAINEMIKIKPTVMNTDLLYGKYTWTDLGNQLFILK